MSNTGRYLRTRMRTPWQPLLLLLTLAVLAAGCQTFNLTKDDFQRQQRGETVDPETGNVVAVVGTLGYYGGAIGAAAVALSK